MSTSHSTALEDAPAETAPSKRTIYTVMSGVMIAMLLAMLDNMIIGTAMPRIVGELGGLAHFSWVVTAYILATTVSTPIWGKLGDLYGRKGTFMASIVLFLIGSVLSGMAQDMTQLIAFRGVQGLGAGGLMVGAMSVIGVLVPPRERGKYQGLMAAVMPVAMIGGPLIGGFITDNLSWRWAFYINIPLGILALAVVALTLHLPQVRIKAKIDYLGIALLTVGITALVLLTTWGGSEYDWASPQIIGLAVLAVVSLIGFVFAEQRAPEPVMPLSLFKNRNFVMISIVGFMVGFAMFGAVTFLPQYQQIVQGASATNSGLLLIPLMAAAMVMSLVSGAIITKTGRYKVFPILGGAGMTIGMFLLAQLQADTSQFTSALYMIALGLGMGLLMQVTMLVTQNSVDNRNMGVASSAATFFRSIGGSFGVSLFGAIFTSRLTSSLTGDLGAEASEKLTSGGQNVDPSMLNQLPAPVHEAYINAVTSGVQGVFGWAILFAAVAFVVAWFIREVPLRGGPTSATQETPERVPALVD